MTREAIPIQGLLPDYLRSRVIKEPQALCGKWIEADKPLNQINSILSRLGLSAVKRRIIGRCHCKVDIEDAEEEKLSDLATTETPSRTDDGTDLPSTAANTPGPADKWGPGMSLVMRQHFPMGRIRESAFVADGETLFDQEDPETDVWKTTVWLEDGVLVQRRVSEKLGVVMFDTRAVLQEPVELEGDDGGKVDGLDPSEPVQIFQWIIVDQKTNETLTARYYLKRTESK